MGQDGQGILLSKNVKVFCFHFFEVLLFRHIVGICSGYKSKTLSRPTGLPYCFSQNSYLRLYGVRLAPPYYAMLLTEYHHKLKLNAFSNGSSGNDFTECGYRKRFREAKLEGQENPG